ncbi:MAG TPA: amino acid adenylation domain-containing protein [Solirubrobacteraceae bacterium]|nr:amino acid adenylation domain-containing protein [Solirubrobacteraceae bacterium]
MSEGAAKLEGTLSLGDLTPAQRALLEQRLMARRTAAARESRIVPRQGDGAAPLSYAQELLWLLSQVFDDGIAYNAPGAFQLQGPLDLEVLARAFAALTERHEILRTTYQVIDGKPTQNVGPVQPVELNVVDLRATPADERDDEAQRILKEESRFRFDLVEGPVMRVTVIQLSQKDHILMVNMHHVATDGYSRTAIYRDLTALYEAFADDRPSPLAPLPIQYADYAVWQRGWLEGSAASGQLEYWKGNLAGAPSRLDLPTDFSRPPVRSYVGSNMSMMLDMAAREGLRTTAQRGDATLFVSLLSLFATLLARYSGQQDVVIGTPFAGRNRTELESMVGYFINPLALRVDLSGDPSFLELIERVRRTTLEAFAHADVPYETVVRATNPERDLSQTPVFQAMIVLHNPAWQTQRPKFEPNGMRCTEITHEKGWSKFDVLLGMSERTTGLNTTWEYSTELFRPSTITRMMEHFRALADSAAASPERPLSRLSMLSEGERAKVLVSWNPAVEPAQVPTPSSSQEPASSREPVSIKEVFEAQAARTPDAPAVVFGEQRLSFAELNARANQIAWRLCDEQVGPGTLVGVLMEKSIDLLPAVLGVVKAGGAYIPLDPMYPQDRLESMISDANPSVLLTHRKHLDTLAEHDSAVVVLDEDATIADRPTENPPTSAGPDDLAYVIYTSGSTGQPKGARIANRSLLSAHFAYEDAYRLHELTAHAQLASFSFDVFTGDMIRSLLAGAKLVLCPLEVVVDPAALYALMLREKIDAAEFVPASASLLFEYAERESLRLDFMRLVVVSSEAWRNEKYAFFKGLCGPETRLINSYGLTEATIDSTWFEGGADSELVPGRFVPIGRPLANTRVYVLDTALEPQAIGIPGELCVGGTAVARGYLNRPELTAQRFVPDPFSDEPDALLYRTGDLARWLPDGTIDFLGRTDRQIKIRGFRIEPGEIESVLERDPYVRATAVTDRQDDAGHSHLVAYLVAKDPADPPAFNELRELIAAQLPAYMIPSAWTVVDSLPMTPNGKVDLDALPTPAFDRSAASEEMVAPRTEAECQLAEIWRQVLDVQELGVHDNFFALGGHSLLAVRLFSEIERQLGARIPLAALFQTATIAGLAALIDDPKPSERLEGWSSVTPMRPGQGRPLFLVGWAGGEVLGYRQLVEHLDVDTPIVGLRAPGVERDRLPLASVEELAAHYVSEIRQAQPEGPYLLGGYCFSGLIAYEMARQLREQGQELAMVALIDSYPAGSSRRPSRLELERTKMREFMASGTSGKAHWLRRRWGGLRALLSDSVYLKSGALAYDVLALRDPSSPLPRLPWRLVLIASSRARQAFVPRPTEIQIDFFRAQREPDERPTPWEGIARVRLHQVVVPEIDHASMMQEPHVRALAEKVRGALQQLGDAARSRPQDETGTSAENNGVAHSSNGSSAVEVGANANGASNGSVCNGSRPVS